MEQLPPIDDLDDEVIVAPSLEFGSSKVRIVAAQKTHIEFFIDGQKKEKVLDSGTYQDAKIYSDHSAYIKAVSQSLSLGLPYEWISRKRATRTCL